MTEYINKESALKSLNVVINTVAEIFTTENCQYIAGLLLAVDKISELPTTDAVSVKNGSWIEKQFPIPLSDGSKTAYKCSNCNTTWDHKTNYCPHCGARMDGDTDAEN